MSFNLASVSLPMKAHLRCFQKSLLLFSIVKAMKRKVVIYSSLPRWKIFVQSRPLFIDVTHTMRSRKGGRKGRGDNLIFASLFFKPASLLQLQDRTDAWLIMSFVASFEPAIIPNLALSLWPKKLKTLPLSSRLCGSKFCAGPTKKGSLSKLSYLDLKETY